MKKIFPFVILIVFSLFAAKAFFLPGFIPTHDGEYHIVRQWQFSRAFEDGQLLHVWAADLNSGYGVPIFEFFYPLPSYIGHLFVILGASYIDAIKLVLAVGLIVSSITFYLWVRLFFKTLPSFVGSIAYVLAPYHTVDVSIRGSAGEVWALAIAPLVLFSLTKLLENKQRSKTYLLLFSVSVMTLLISHNVVGLLFFLVSICYGMMYCYIFKKSFRLIFIASLYAVALSTFFWFPIIFESRHVTGLNINNYAEHFPTLLQLVIPSWGTGFSVAGDSDQMSFQLGLVHISAILIGTVIAIKKKNTFMLSVLIVFFISIFFMLEVSDVLWKIISPIQIMQFPWRLLSVATLLSSFLIVYVCEVNRKMAWVYLVLASILYFPYTMPVVYLPREDVRYIADPEWINGTTTWGNTFTIKEFVRPDKIPSEEFNIIEGEGDIVGSRRRTSSSNAEIELKTPATVEVKRAYFPGWQVYVNDRKHEIKPLNGIIRLELPIGHHRLDVQFKSSAIRTQASAISLLTFAVLLLFNFPYLTSLLKKDTRWLFIK